MHDWIETISIFVSTPGKKEKHSMPNWNEKYDLKPPEKLAEIGKKSRAFRIAFRIYI